MKMTEVNNAVEPSVTEEDVRLLIKRKEEIEEQIKAYYDMLQAQGGVGMDGPLVDVEGFPRADVDLYKVRTARHSISCLQNDHKAIMVEIEEALHRLHATARVRHEKDETKMEATEQSVSPPSPFALVDAVTQGSPAFQAGLRVGDEIMEFGSVNTQNFRNLRDIASVVQHSEGKSLRVGLFRNGQEVHLNLTPRNWSGRGLLGCNLVPLQR
ncbi:26S proteasome non-ATPase regulatory subunit 9 isoform X1 [Megalobrama amblycephala]|uniref:26S proteasome non-ATPase regulatory subunit 9 isoform X1 n=1 Tax=Megalobrama amblycephala TaxID=75352 RepID=UPI002013DC55|nr:26S proteasome non-ATPase regulatory subunit 9 isoform X1 [Megalobrama amblycephala]XP_048041243.1 26S proteasome non-ATPase regulatory subunit 9 isoform X1 [Megalobrama amblycephala]